MRRIAIILLALVYVAAGTVYAQSGYFSEIKAAFTNQTSLLPPSPILTPGPNDGSYLICTYISQTPADTVGVDLDWTDASGNPETAVLVSAPESGETGGCAPIRNKANTTPTIKATGFYSANYSIYVVGLGFWNVGPDKQAGITEPIVGSYPAQTANLLDTALLVPTDYATYLVAITLVPHSSLDTVKATLNWSDDYSYHVFSVSSCPGCPAEAVIPIRAVPRTAVSIWTSGTVNDSFDLYIRGVKFGTPAKGTGPLAFYGRTFLDWVNPVAYNEGLVPAGMWMMAATGEYASVAVRRLTLNGFPVSATTGTVPVVSGLAAAYEPNGGNEWFYTICGSYECPEYSAEFNLVVF